MSASQIFAVAIGPYGALFLALVAVIALWRKLEQTQAMMTRQQDLFDEAMKVIRELWDASRRR